MEGTNEQDKRKTVLRMDVDDSCNTVLQPAQAKGYCKTVLQLNTHAQLINYRAAMLCCQLQSGNTSAAISANTALQGCCQWVGRELWNRAIAEHNQTVALRKELGIVRQERQHLIGSPRDYAALSAEESRLVRELGKQCAHVDHIASDAELSEVSHG